MMIKYYTQIIRGEIKKGLPKDFLFVYYVYAMCMSMNYNRLTKLFSINMQILNKKSLWHEFSTIKITQIQVCQPQDKSIPKNAEESKLTDDSKKGFEKEVGFRKEVRMAEGKLTNLTSDADIKGTIKFGEAMRIDGRFDGELITDNGELIVGKTGDVKANVKVRSAVIEGRVEGNIKASDKVEFKQKAQLMGDLQAKALVIEEGVVFVGKCNVNPEGVKTEGQGYKEGIKERNKR